MALKITFFKTPKPKQFAYKPRIWNPEKEEREKRLMEIEEEMGIRNQSDKSYRPNIRGRFRELYENEKKTKKAVYGDKLKLLIILGTIVLLFIAMFYFARMFPMFFSQQNIQETTSMNFVEDYVSAPVRYFV
ncbi:MAG: hypothetical protein LBD59_08970 [Prevotellaceae bacterium]|jgi:hypothetical protein|nr:hypothetical protein [Prevotellaceae bacterium]